MKPSPLIVLHHPGPDPEPPWEEPLAQAGYRLLRCPSLRDVRQALADREVEAILYHLPLPDGDPRPLDQLRRLCREAGHLPLLLLVRPASVWPRAGFLKEGVSDFLELPLDPEELLARLGLHLSNRKRIRELVERSETYERMSFVDEKTGLFNWRYFNQRLKEEFARSQRHHAPLSLLILDLDDFKSINESYDYQYGDFVLHSVAERLMAAVREIDIPGRFGGDEFVVLLPETTGPDAERLGERLQHIYDGTVLEKDGRSVRITVSIGISTFEGGGLKDPIQLFRNANQALQSAKLSGKNAVQRFAEEPVISDQDAGRPGA